MAREYMGLAVCMIDGNEKSILVECPPFADLKQGDKVVVQGLTDIGRYATIVSRYDARINDVYHELEFILSASDSILPLRKIVSKVTYHNYEYEEEENGELNQD